MGAVDIHTMRANDWNEISSFYESLGWAQPMKDLVSSIIASQLSKVLYAATSMHTLCVSQLDPLPWHHDMLTIEFDPKVGKVKFEYWEQPFAPKNWTKIVNAPETYSAFRYFLKLKNWIAELPGEPVAAPITK